MRLSGGEETTIDTLISTKAMTLEELLGMVRDYLAVGLPDAYWITAEVTQMRQMPKGYRYIDLVQKTGETVVAQSRAVAWSDVCRTALPRFEAETGLPLRVGMSVMLKVSVTFHPVFGLSLTILDIDPTYTLGDMARKRKEVIDRLGREGLLDRNKALRFPLVPQRIAVLSSASAAGYEDFVHQIQNNIHGYGFRHQLFPSIMQGQAAEPEVVAALGRAAKVSDEYDLLVLIRGGGSTLDLSCFDGYSIAAAIGAFPIPVITGIGHERDETVADMAAHTRAKTPTAAAEHIVGAVRDFEDRILEARERIVSAAESILIEKRQRLERTGLALSRQAGETCVRERTRLTVVERDLMDGARRKVERQTNRLTNLETKLHLLDPVNVLRRGYSITYAGGKLLREVAQAPAGTSIETHLQDGIVRSTVTADASAPPPTSAPSIAPTPRPAKRAPAKPAESEDLTLGL